MNRTKPDKETTGEWVKFFDDFQIFLRWVLAGLIDAGFIVLWVFVQYWVNQMTATKQLAGLDQWQLDTFKLIFAVSTLAAIVTKILGDLFELIVNLWIRVIKLLEKMGIQVQQSNQSNARINQNPGMSASSAPLTANTNAIQSGEDKENG